MAMNAMSVAKPRVFVSYDRSEDVRHERVPPASVANTEFEFGGHGPEVRSDICVASIIMATLTKHLQTDTQFLAFVGSKNDTSKWKRREIDRSKPPEPKLQRAAVKLVKNIIAPAELRGVCIAWATSSELDCIVRALTKDACANN